MTLAGLRVCFVTPEYPPHVGGVAHSAHRIVDGLSAAGAEVCVVAPGTPGAVGNALGQPPGRVLVVRVAGVRDVVERIFDLDARRAFDLFHGFTLPAAYPCLPAASRGRRPVIASIRGIDGAEFNDMTARVLREAAWITSVSSDSLARATTVCDIRGRCSVIPNGIDAARFPAWQPTEANAGVVGTVATFRPKKNIPLLLEAYASLPAAIRKRLVLVGDFYDADRLALEECNLIRARAQELGLVREALFTGYVNNGRIPEYHQQMRVFALSSDHEGMPNAVLEAAATGMPIVSTAVDGVKDLLTHGRDALLVPPGDRSQLATAIEALLTNEPLARALGQAARTRVQALTPAVERDRYIELYQRLLVSVRP